MSMEKYFMSFIGILSVCLIASVVLYKPRKNKPTSPGYKCMKDALGPGKGYCMNVADSPDEKAGVYKDLNECAKNCGVVFDNVSFMCGKGEKGAEQCVQVQQPVNPVKGFYKDEKECSSFCKAGQFVK